MNYYEQYTRETMSKLSPIEVLQQEIEALKSANNSLYEQIALNLKGINEKELLIRAFAMVMADESLQKKMIEQLQISGLVEADPAE